MNARFTALTAVFILSGCGHAPVATTQVPAGFTAAAMPSGKLDPRVPPVQSLVEAFVGDGYNAGKLQHFTSFRFLSAPVPGLEGQHGMARGWLSDASGKKTADFRVEFVAFDDLNELHAAKCWTYPVAGQEKTRALGAGATLKGLDDSVNTDPAGPAIQWATEQFIQGDVKPGATPHFTTFRLLDTPMPGGWEGQHFSANGWLSVDGKHATDAIYVEGAFDKDGGLMRAAMCYRFPKDGGKPVLYSSSPRSLARML